MATYGGDDVAFILIDGYSIGGYLNELSDSKEAVLEETHCWGDSWVERSFTGLLHSAFDIGGFFDDTDNLTNEALVAMSGGVRTICYALQGNTTGNDVTMLYGPIQGHYERIASKGTLHKVKAHFDGSGEVEEGKIIATLAARTTAADTTATPVDNDAASTAGGSVYLQMPALTLGGYTNIVVKLQDSADDITYGDVTGGTFTAVTEAPAKERLATAADLTIKQYTAVAWSWTGAGTGQTATFMVGLHRN